MTLTRLRTLVLVLCLSILSMGATIQNMTSRATDVSCSIALDGTVWYNTTTSLLRKCVGGTAVTITTGPGIGSSIQISTTGDINEIFKELTPDVWLFDVSIPWPLADALAENGANCPTGQFPRGVDDSGVSENCTALPTTIAGTSNQINISAPTGPVVISIPNNPTLPGTTTGTFSGPLTGAVTGNVVGNVTGNVSGTASALATNGANAAAGNAILGVDTTGAAEGSFDVATQIEFDAHLNDTSNAHTASAIGFSPNGSIAGTNLQTAVQEVRDEGVRIGGPSPCAETEISKTTSGLWACSTDASSGGGGTPGGATTQVQINIAGAFAGDADLTWDTSLNRLTSTGGFVGPLIGNAATATTAAALTADGANCSAGQFTPGVDTLGAAQGCTPLPTSITGTANQIAASAATGAIVLSIPSSPTLPGTTTGTFSGPLTGNVTGNAATSTALAADGANCGAGQFPLGVSTTGAAQNCTPLPTTIAGTANQITASAATGSVVLSITTNPTLPGNTTGNFVGPLTGNAQTATSLFADGGDCPVGQAPLGVDASGVAEGCFAVTALADDRLPAMQTPAALSAASQITCTKPTQLITGSGGPVTLTNAAWLVNGVYNGQECELQNSSTTNTVTGPTTATIINCGGLGSVVIGKNHATPTYKWTGALWQQQGCVSPQTVLNSGAKVFAGLTAAAPIQFRGGTADAPSTTGVNGYDNGSSTWVWESVCAGGACDLVRSVPAGKNEVVLLAGVETERTTVAGLHTYTDIGRPRGTLWWDAAALKPDGTHCTTVSPTVNSGPVIDGITCNENAAAKLSAKVRLPDRYVGGSLFCRLTAHDVDSSGHVSGWDARAQCRTPGTDAINATWSTPVVAMNVTMTTAFIPYSNAEVTITPNGTCVGGDMLFIELNMNTGANTDETTGDAVIEGLTCEYLQGSRGD